MAKKTKILIFLLLIPVLLILYLIFTSESIWPMNNPTDNSADQLKSVESVLLEEDYKVKIKGFFAVYEDLIKNNSFNSVNIAELKNKLLDLKVPAEFKELHIRFVLALTKMENYLNQKDGSGKSDSLEAESRLKADYGWLSN